MVTSKLVLKSPAPSPNLMERRAREYSVLRVKSWMPCKNDELEKFLGSVKRQVRV
jgi:hypothetical protein